MPTNRDLQSKATKAMAHLGLGGALGKLVSLGTTLILARMLTPADYGMMALAMIVISFVGFFNEVGIGAAIVQKTTLTTTEVNGCFVIAIIISVILCAVTILGSGLAADFFKTPQLQPMISVLAVAFIFGSFGTVPMAYLRKEMQFKIIAGLNVIGVLVLSVVSIILAVKGFGAWSLIWGFIGSSLIQSIGAYLFSPWSPRGGYNLREAADLVFYGLHVTTSRIFWYLYSNADKVIIGKMLGTRSVGIYDMAFGLATLPSSQVTTLVTNVASPLFSRMQNDLPQISVILIKLTRGIVYITYPVLIGMLACSRELISVILGDKWIDILIPFNALCLLGLVKSFDPLLSQVLISTGHAAKLSAYTAVCGIVMSLAVVIGASMDGLRGVSLVWIVVYPLLTVKLLSDVCKITGMSMFNYYRNLLPVLLATTVMFVVVLTVREVCLRFTNLPPLILFMEVLSGMLAYLLWMVYMNNKSIDEIKHVLIDIGISSHRLNCWPFVRATNP